MELKYKNRAIRSVTAEALQTFGKAYGHVYCKSVELAADSREWSRENQKTEAVRLCSILARTISIIKSSYPNNNRILNALTS